MMPQARSRIVTAADLRATMDPHQKLLLICINSDQA
jgi:hypothetical protein